MDNIYEVEKDDYITFIGQLNKNLMDVELFHTENYTWVKVISKKTKKLLCTRGINPECEQELYYIYNYPDDDERCEPKAVCKIKLESREEVQAFFDAISKLQKEAKENAGTV